jgi:tight adherence protein B
MSLFILLLVILLATAGLFLLFGLRFRDVFFLFYRPFREHEIQRRKVERITGKKAGFIRAQILQSEQMLNDAGNGEQLIQYSMASVLLAIGGFMAGLATGIILVAIVLPVGLALIPLMVIQQRTATHGKLLNIALESGLTTLTNHYIQSGDFLGSIRDCLIYLPKPVDGLFKRCLIEVETVNPSVTVALRNMQIKVKNKMWREWCNIVIQCQANNQLRYTLLGVVERLSEVRQINEELDTLIKESVREYIMIVVSILLCVPILGFALPSFWEGLTETLLGQVTFSAVILIIFISLLWVIKLSKPVTVE